MIENPFIITEKIVPEYFCDREHESAQMIKLLKNGNNIVLISPRRLGKTGLIQFCFENKDIKDNFLTIYLDILSTSNLQEFTFLLGREVFDTIRNRGEKIWKSFLNSVKSIAGKIGFDPISGLPSLNLQLGDVVKPEYTLKEIFQYLSHAEKPCVLAIDEFQQVTNYPDKNVEALLRSHLLQINNVRMIFSGSERHILSGIFMESSRPFYQSASMMDLHAIPRDIYADFIIQQFERKRKHISRRLAEKIYDTFDGTTFYIQRVSNAVFSNTPSEGEAGEEILAHSMDEILGSFDTIFRMRLSALTLRQKELLLAIASEKVVEKITSASFIRNHSLASASAIQTALKSLMKDGIVIKSEKGYLIDDRFFQLWLQSHY